MLSWNFFCLTVAVTMPSAAELYVLIGVGGWERPSSWSVICRGTAICPFLNSPPTSALVAETTTCLRIIHSVWIGPFAGGGRFGEFSGRLVVSSVNSDLQCGCVPLDMIGMMHHCQCELSYC